MNEFVASLLPALILLALVFLPVGVVVTTVLFQKWKDKRNERRSPLTDKLLHQAGAHARKRADEIGDSILEHLMQVMLIGPMVMLIILLPRVNWSKLEFSWINWLVVIGAGAWIAWLTDQPHCWSAQGTCAMAARYARRDRCCTGTGSFA